MAGGDAVAGAGVGEAPLAESASKEVSQSVPPGCSMCAACVCVCVSTHRCLRFHAPPSSSITHQTKTLTSTDIDKQEALKELGEWASRYEMIAAMGYLALLLMVGKAVNNLGKAVKVRESKWYRSTG
jgi:hypothetical protein